MRRMTELRSSLLLGACLAVLLFASTVASAVPHRRFYTGPYSANGYAGYPNCSVATFSALQGVDFQRQYDADGFLYRLIKIENWRDCHVTVLPHLNSQNPQSLHYAYGDVLFYGRNGNSLCNGPYNETMTLGYTNDNGNSYVLSNWSSIVNSLEPTGSFRYAGAVAILDCATPPAPQKPAEKRFFIGAYSGRGYLPDYPNCTVATLQAFQSSAFLQQYNQYGSLSQLGLVDPSLDCGIDVAPYPGAEPGRLSYSGGTVAPFGASGGQQQCNGPYNAAMKIGVVNMNDNGINEWFDTITPDLQQAVSVSSFVYTGSVALYDCGVPAVVKPPPAQRFRLAAYDSSGYASIDPNCSVATLVAFQSSAFREQYNYYSALPWFGPPASGLNCEPVVIPYAGGDALIGSLSYQGGSIAPFGLDGALLCNGWYNATMRIGVTNEDDNGVNKMFDSIWPSMQNAASVGSFDYSGSLALIDCASPAAPAPVPAQRFWLGAYTSNATTTLGGRTCQVATLEAFQSPAFRHQYNHYHALGVLGALPNALDCRIVITSSTKPFTAATVSFDYGQIVTFGRDGNELCNGPYNSTMKIGCSNTNNNGNSAIFDSLTQSMQNQSGLGQFYTNVSIALYDCGGADRSG